MLIEAGHWNIEKDDLVRKVGVLFQRCEEECQRTPSPRLRESNATLHYVKFNIYRDISITGRDCLARAFARGRGHATFLRQAFDAAYPFGPDRLNGRRDIS